MHLLAHQGGWDELGWFIAPIAAMLLWVRWAERKARARATRGDAGPTIPSTLPPHDHDT